MAMPVLAAVLVAAERPWGLVVALLAVAALALVAGLVALRHALNRGRGTPPRR
jgi:hypothetical protein